MNHQKICLISDNHPDILLLEKLLHKNDILVLHQTVSPSNELADFLQSEKGKSIYRIQAETDQIFPIFEKSFDHLDLYLKACSPILSKPFLTITEEEFHQENSWNWRNAFFGVCEAAKYFRNKRCGGSIILITYIDQKLTRPGRVLSGTISAALQKLTQYAAAELGQYGVTAGCIAVNQGEEYDPIQIPSGTTIDTADLADAIAFLSSHPATTGNLLFLDGGASLLDDSPEHYGLTQGRIQKRR